MVKATNLGFPRIGANRELKKLVENFWAGKVDQKSLLTGAKKDAGIEIIPSNDFSFYDQVLDTCVLFGAIPARYSALNELQLYFAMARGLQKPEEGIDVPAMEMKKWFDTNYHFIVPEFETNQQFALVANPKPLQEFKEAVELGIQTRPVLLGPLTFLSLGKPAKGTALSSDLSVLLGNLVPAYSALLTALVNAGAQWIQIDEPILSLDLPESTRAEFQRVYETLAQAAKGAKLMVANYFGRLGDNAEVALALPVNAIHIDLVRAPEELDSLLSQWPQGKILSMGVINGRNIWRSDLTKCLEMLNNAVGVIGSEHVFVAPSCSLLHSPVSKAAETKMDKRILNWLCFATEKLDEIVALSQALNKDEDAVKTALQENKNSVEERRKSPLIHDEQVQAEMSTINDSMKRRKAPFSERYAVQRQRLGLPMFPTTTIGSFPQTKELRVGRQKFKKGEWSQTEYDEFIKRETEACIRLQEQIGLDVLVHGECERNDMVEFFGENMKGYVFSQNGWVQSYGSRCVKPPIIYGDVSRPSAMTVDMILYAQSLTEKPMKGMLTGPVTMLQWSFVRDDQPRRDTTFQLALALRKEVRDLEKAGIKVIQIDEPAIREGLPLRRADWDAYLKWAVDSFLLASTGVENHTQIHSHFCYSDFNDIFTSIKRLDADVITIENARSDLKLLEAFKKYEYTNGIGPGVYDIHSPRVPSPEEMAERMGLIVRYVNPQLLWINPDCGLKTRKQDEVVKSLTNMVQVAQQMRGKK